MALNYHLNKVIGDNETGFAGTNDFSYRREGWEFIIAGGGLFNNLDYSFTIDNEDGTFHYPPKQPGGGGRALRRELGILKDFMYSFDFVHMSPDTITLTGPLPDGIAAGCLSHPGSEYAIYLCVRPKIIDEYSVVWTGHIEPPRTGEYTFYALSNDGVRLAIDGHLVIDNWTGHSSKEDKGTARLEAGKKHPVQLAYYQGGGDAAMKLYWSQAGLTKQLIAKTNLWVPDNSVNGLTGKYYYGTNFDELKMTRNDGTINFDWSKHSPFDAARPANLSQSLNLQLNLPAGNYEAEWINPKTGKAERREKVRHSGGTYTLASPSFQEDIALSIRK